MLTRRTMLASVGAAGASLFGLPAVPTFGAASTVRTAVDFDVPRGACDCHVHVFDPAHYPYVNERAYTPPEASVADLRDLQAALRFDPWSSYSRAFTEPTIPVPSMPFAGSVREPAASPSSASRPRRPRSTRWRRTASGACG